MLCFVYISSRVTRAVPLQRKDLSAHVRETWQVRGPSPLHQDGEPRDTEDGAASDAQRRSHRSVAHRLLPVFTPTVNGIPTLRTYTTFCGRAARRLRHRHRSLDSCSYKRILADTAVFSFSLRAPSCTTQCFSNGELRNCATHNTYL
jgi:hypothetical protein